MFEFTRSSRQGDTLKAIGGRGLSSQLNTSGIRNEDIKMSTTNNSNISNKPDSLKETQFGGSHYKSMGIEPVQYIEANGINFTLGSAIKYITRHSVKNGAVDLKKAVHFIAMDLERVYGIKLTFSFSDDVQLPPDNPDERHGPGGEIDLREHGPGVDVAPVRVKSPQDFVTDVYPQADWYHPEGQTSKYAIDKDCTQPRFNWISDVCETVEEAWQSALNRIHQSQVSQSGSSISNVSTAIQTPAPVPLPSNSLQSHVAVHPPAAIRASKSSGGEINGPGAVDIQSY